MEVTIEAAVRIQCRPGSAHQSVCPLRGDRLRGTELAPKFAQGLDVRHLVGFGAPRRRSSQPSRVASSAGAFAMIGVKEFVDRMVDRRPIAPEELSTFSSRRSLEAAFTAPSAASADHRSHLLDLAHRFCFMRWIAGCDLPAERVAPKASLELPVVGLGLRHALTEFSVNSASAGRVRGGPPGARTRHLGV